MLAVFPGSSFLLLFDVLLPFSKLAPTYAYTFLYVIYYPCVAGSPEKAGSEILIYFPEENYTFSGSP